MKTQTKFSLLIVLFSLLLVGFVWLNTKLQPNIDKINSTIHPKETTMDK